MLSALLGLLIREHPHFLPSHKSSYSSGSITVRTSAILVRLMMPFFLAASGYSFLGCGTSASSV